MQKERRCIIEQGGSTGSSWLKAASYADLYNSQFDKNSSGMDFRTLGFKAKLSAQRLASLWLPAFDDLFSVPQGLMVGWCLTVILVTIELSAVSFVFVRRFTQPCFQMHRGHDSPASGWYGWWYLTDKRQNILHNQAKRHKLNKLLRWRRRGCHLASYHKQKKASKSATSFALGPANYKLNCCSQPHTFEVIGRVKAGF